MSQIKIYIFAVSILLMTGCQRGQYSSKPPVHPVHDMDHQPKYKTQSANTFFADKAAMRMPASGTVAAGQLRADEAFYAGMDATGKPLPTSPVASSAALVEVGKARYSIYCTPCHSPLGDGQGAIVKRGFIPPPVFWEERLRTSGDGYLFGVIGNGIRNMPAHGYLVPAADRWAIVAYVRTLQEIPAR